MGKKKLYRCILFSLQRSGFSLGAVDVGSMVDKFELGQAFLQILGFSPPNSYSTNASFYHLPPGINMCSLAVYAPRDYISPHCNTIFDFFVSGSGLQLKHLFIWLYTG
jgi:hypothetical protein